MDPNAPIAAAWPILVYLTLAALLVGALLWLSSRIGERHRGQDTAIPYESGVTPVHSGELRPSVRFYLVAVMFVIFDLEAAFLFAWAVAARDVGWPGYLSMSVFVLILALALWWLVRRGVLRWLEHATDATSTLTS
jgi:NADH-quinone oxidoreductase subunit A